MEDDKKLKELMQQWAMEEAPADFTQNIMQHIEATVAKKETDSLYKNSVLRILAAAFILTFIALLFISIGSKMPTSSFHFNLAIPASYANYISQLTSFIVVFWIVMAGNQLYQRRSKYFV